MALPEIFAHRLINNFTGETIQIGNQEFDAVRVDWTETHFFGLLRILHSELHTLDVGSNVRYHNVAHTELNKCPPAQKEYWENRVKSTNSHLPSSLQAKHR